MQQTLKAHNIFKTKNIGGLSVNINKYITGAFNITKEAQIRSQEAQMIVDGTKDTIEDSENVRGRVEKMLEENEDEFNRRLNENQEAIDELNEEVTELSDKITDINNMVSGKTPNIELFFPLLVHFLYPNFMGKLLYRILFFT